MKRFLLLGAIAIALSGCVSDDPYGGGYGAYGDRYDRQPIGVYQDRYRPRTVYRDDRDYREYRNDRPSYRAGRPVYRNERPNDRSTYREPYRGSTTAGPIYGPRSDYKGNEYQMMRERRALYGDD